MLNEHIDKLNKIRELKEDYEHMEHNRQRHSNMLQEMIDSQLNEGVITTQKRKLREVEVEMRELATLLIVETL